MTNPGTTSDCLSYFPDWFPTICRAAGVAIPEQLELDGVDLSVALAGGGEPKRTSPLFWDFVEYGGIVAARDGKWKAIRRDVNKPKPLAWELYDIESDRAEAYDLASTHPEIVQRLEAALLKSRTVEPDFPNKLYDPLTQPAENQR